MAVADVSAESAHRFRKLYDHYFPKNSEYQNTGYRRWFDTTLFGPPPKPGEDSHSAYYALRGNAEAFRAFAHHPDRDAQGEFALTWTKECLILLLHLGDDRFSELLAREDRETRELVGSMIDIQVDWTKHRFPKTRRLYSYRYISPSHQAFEKKHGRRLSLLIAAVAADPRFSNVRVYNRGEQTPAILITVPRSLPMKDREDLRHLVQRFVGKDAVLTFAD